MIHSPTANTLVTLLKSPHDWEILLNHGIYCIRDLKHPPAMLTERRVKYLGFYLPAAFGKHKFSVRHYAKVAKISMAPIKFMLISDEAAASEQGRLRHSGPCLPIVGMSVML